VTAEDAAAIESLAALAALHPSRIPEPARQMATLSLFDWCVVAVAGRQEPVARIVREQIADEGGRLAATVAGSPLKAPPRAAALANGAISHALDYDDTHFAHVGHPSVAVLPAALALAEDRDLSATAMRDAFLVGAEASVRLGVRLGRAHYDRGFHQTATAGAFGATVAAGRLVGLSSAQMRMALSLVSTRASGLKSQFGTMGKPFNAGMAAANGVEAALLAARGFVSCDDGIGGPQGFLATHTDAPGPAMAADSGRFLFEDITHKFHACCHGTHAMIEALGEAMSQHPFAGADVARIEVTVNPRWLSVCDIKAPRSGLEIKFSYVFLAAMTVAGRDTAAESSYTSDLCHDPVLQALAQRVSVTVDEGLPDTATEVVVTLADGRTLTASHDLAQRRPAGEIAEKLRRKAAALIGPAAAERLWTAVADLDQRSARDLAAMLV
jgi:2-methylcitrate dehydratase PrpD